MTNEFASEGKLIISTILNNSEDIPSKLAVFKKDMESFFLVIINDSMI